MGDLATTFKSFATKANGAEATTKDLTRWFTDCGILTKKSCNSNNLDICFSKVKQKGKNTITLKEMTALIAEVAKAYKTDHKLGSDGEAVNQMTEKLAGGKPMAHGTTKASATGGVDRMTDTSKYTGSHKERFDAEGKGKGMAGREDLHDNSGYVGAYKGSGTYNDQTS